MCVGYVYLLLSVWTESQKEEEEGEEEEDDDDMGNYQTDDEDDEDSDKDMGVETEDGDEADSLKLQKLAARVGNFFFNRILKVLALHIWHYIIHGWKKYCVID